MVQDWRFESAPLVEFGGLRAYAGVPLRLQNEAGDTVCLGSICVASPDDQEPLTRAQQVTLARLGDWIVADIVQHARVRRQRERHRMAAILALAQEETDATVSEEPVMQKLQTFYSASVVSLQTCRGDHIEFKGQHPILLSQFSSSLWEDTGRIDDYIAKLNHLEPPIDKVIRAIATPCESISGHSFLVVGSREFRQIFDDIDAWFVQSCAGIISQVWQKKVLSEVMAAKEKFLRGFSHQLRTPVHGILGSVELLAEDLKLRSLRDTVTEATAFLQSTSNVNRDDEPALYLKTIKSAGRDLISIINNMIKLNRWSDVATTDRQYATYTALEVENELVCEMQKMITGDTRYNVPVFLNHNTHPDRYSIQTDLGLLRDSLLPVVINAIQNTKHGLVEVTVSARPESDELVVDVKDTGCGIPIDDRQRIFELYEQVDVYSTGAGLGLTLASRFAALLNGSIDLVSSEVGHGSHFRATFHDVRLNETDHLDIQPTFSLNLPRRLRIVPSSSECISLADHFARSLACFGFTASNDTKNVLTILDFVDDTEQHRAALSRIPSDQVVICIVPTAKGEVRLEKVPANVTYVHGPIGTKAISDALKQAQSAISLCRLDHTNTTDTIKNHALMLELGDPTRRVRIESEAEPDNRAQLVCELATEHRTDCEQPLHGAVCSRDQEYNVVEKPKDCLPVDIENRLSLSPLLSSTDQILALPPKEASDRPELNVDASELHCGTKIAPNFPDTATTSHPTLLLVDDNAINMRVMEMYCKKRKLQYVCAKDGLQAVSAFHERQASAVENRVAPFQLILMDLQMPFCDGIEATRRIRQLEKECDWQKCIVFVVTGQDSTGDREAARKVGSQEFFVKPLSIQDLDVGVKRYFPSFSSK